MLSVLVIRLLCLKSKSHLKIALESTSHILHNLEMLYIAPGTRGYWKIFDVNISAWHSTVLFLNFGVPSLNSVIHLPAAVCTCSHFLHVICSNKYTLSSNNGLILFVMDCKWMKILSICDIKIFRYIYLIGVNGLNHQTWFTTQVDVFPSLCIYLHSFICSYYCTNYVPISVDLHLLLYPYYSSIYYMYMLNITTAFTLSNKTQRRRKIKCHFDIKVAMRNRVSMSLESLWTYWYICIIYFSFFYPHTIVMHLHTSPKNPRPKQSWTYY